jgi:septal ring factor EnvC (AmiA/AmiB activator)
LGKLNLIHKETNGKLAPFLKLYKQLIKQKGMSVDQVIDLVEIAIHKLPYMESLYRQAKDQAEKMQCTIQRLSNDMHALEYKISILDKTAFSCEQECRRIKQELYELIDKKERLEKLIASILNNDDLKQFIKENVKAALSENKQLISVSFTALLHTLKSDPQMINIIYKIVTANDGEQQKDNNDNAIKYLESHKDNILDLAEKNYENVVEALTNNAINNGAASTSSFTFPNSLNQGDIYRIEEPEVYEVYDNNKGDIAD